MKFFLISLLLITSKSFAWDFGGKAEIERSSTDNANLTDMVPISDTYLSLNGYVQAKNEMFKVKFRAKKEKYHTQLANDNYLTDFSVQYKHSKNDDYTLAVFKQVYDGTTIISTDITSDNYGAKAAATFSNDFTNDTYGYLSFTGNLKRYPKIIGRTDRIIGGIVGVEYNFTSYLSVTPEFVLQRNFSADPYYNNLSFWPSFTISLTPVDHWEIFVDGSYAKTNYSGRVYSVVTNGTTQNEKETQTLITIDVGTIYKFSKMISLEAKYSNGKNSSNNPVSMYKTNIVSLSLGLKI